MKILIIMATMLLISCVSNTPPVDLDVVTSSSSSTAIISSSSVSVDNDLYIPVDTNGSTTTYEKSYTTKEVRFNDLARYTKTSPYVTEEFSTTQWSYVGRVDYDSAWTFVYIETSPVIIRNDSIFHLNDSLRGVFYPLGLKIFK